MLSVGLSQAIYTPNLDLRTRTADERSFAGWLGADVGLLRDRDDQFTAFTLSVGVTGPPSLAEPAQKAVHRTFGFRPPVGWDTQLPTEVAFAAGYQGGVNVIRLRSERSGLRLLVAPLWSARVGTLATDATAGVELTAGLRPPSPWQTQPNARRDRWALFARAGASQRLVGRNLFLDGSTFGGGVAGVPRERWVSETSLGVGVRLPEGMLVEWRVHSLTREYERQPKAHAYSTFAFAFR
jgi:lipid A 3-O-deacylase